MSISEALTGYMDAKRLTQAEVAEKVGIARSTLSNWARGRTIQLEYLAPLAAALGLDDQQTKSFIAEGERAYAEDKGALELLQEEQRRVQKLQALVLSLSEQLEECRTQKESLSLR